MRKDVIRQLPDSVANQIAAGEVIQRPASVIKELVENAVDAGATDVQIFIKDAGRTLIQVVDNGTGMSATDARMAFERHATSKISRADDLFRLHTMGFRGEALPSICAISQMELRTRTQDDATGTRLLITGSKVECQETCVCDKGTSLSVRNLFFNVPARRKFLKSDTVELSNIMREFERLALVNNNIRLKIDTGARIIDLRAATFHQRIHDIWKNNLKMQLLPVNVNTALVKIEGFVSRPEFARRRNALQFLIVNGRNMRHPYFRKAILSCYDGLIAADTQPCFFLKFEVDPASIDVNIHPTKSEIKFEYESEIWPLLVAGVKASLGKNSAVPSIDFDSAAVPVVPLRGGENPEPPDSENEASYNPYDAGRKYCAAIGSGIDRLNRSSMANWDTLYNDFMNVERESRPADEFAKSSVGAGGELPGLDAADTTPRRGICLQYAMKYIIATTREGIIVIDQYRAHLRVLYEKFIAMSCDERSVSQSVMFPETIELDPEQLEAYENVSGALAEFGFAIETTPEGGLRITAVPASLTRCDPKDIVMSVIDSVSDHSVNYGEDDNPIKTLRQRICLEMARGSAITRGYRMTDEEMENLVAELFALPDPLYTPHGRQIYAVLDEMTIKRMLP